MDNYHVIGKSVQRKEGPSKVTGEARYTNDYSIEGLLHGRVVMSSLAHGRIKSIDILRASKVSGVRAIITGKDCPILTGSTIMDKPPIAIDKVRYFGEPVAIVVADSEAEAMRASQLIKVEYEPLPVVNSPSEAFKNNRVLVHERLQDYKILDETYPKPGTNIANHTKIRKGNTKAGFEESDVIIETRVSFPQSDHASMETRSSMVQILADGRVIIYTSTQSPFPVKELISFYFNIDPGKVIVNVPLVGGAYGGKTPVHLEVLAYIASKAVDGRPVKITNTREEDLISSPVHIGLDGRVRLGATQDGMLRAAEITYLFDGGAYADRAVIISRAAAVDCTGPYNINNVWCDSFCMYTNHPFATAFRGFGHSELTFAMERAMDVLANKLNMDPLELRLKNAILPGDTTPTQTLLDRSSVGNLPMCIQRLSELMKENEEEKVANENLVRTWGVSGFWKTSNTPTNAGAGAVLTFNQDGSININCGAVEIGQGTKTVLAQILGEKMKMSVDDIHVYLEVNTKVSPEHWKTAASRSILLCGRAVLDAADDMICQIKDTASKVLGVPAQELEVGEGKVTVRGNPKVFLNIKDVAFGYTSGNGPTIGKQIIGRGSYVMKGLIKPDPETGRGRPGPEWTVGAAAVEVELNTKDYSYKIIKAITVVDAGRVLNENAARGQIAGGMNMGLSFASREAFYFMEDGKIRNTQLRTYKLIRFGENPHYLADFIETPNNEGPYGSRGIGEYGVIGMPAALASSLSNASGVPLNELPLIPELIWRVRRGIDDSL